MMRRIFELQNPWRKQPFSFRLKKRSILPILQDNLTNPKIIGLLGSRQVGKSSLIYLLIQHLQELQIANRDIFYFNLDDLKLHELFRNLPDFLEFIQSGTVTKYIFIDEIQRLENPGLFLKELYDLRRNIKIIYSGSSQIEIRTKLKEHLVGRARQFIIHQLSFAEIMEFCAPTTRSIALEEALIYGGYPGVVLESDKLEKQLVIKDIYQSYIEKDVADFLRIDNIETFNKLLILLANQIGDLLNIENLARTLRAPRKEIEKYLTILEHTFVSKRIYPFHRNYKKELSKTPKIYLLDLGLRNFILNNFTPIELRPDTGSLFENFYLNELLNQDPYGLQKINFWRTTNQTEIDFIITQGQQQRAMEIKWNRESRPKSFNTLNKYYPEITPEVITRKHFLTNPQD